MTKNTTTYLMQGGLILAFALPYLHIAWTGRYYMFLSLLLNTLLRLDASSLFVALGFVMIIVQALRGRYIRGQLYEVILFTLVMILMVIPSLAVPVLVFLAPKYITLSINLYFTGLTTIVAISPMLLFLYQSEVIAKTKGGVTAPASLTLSNYVLIVLLTQTMLTQPTEGLEIAAVGVRILTTVVVSLWTLLTSLAGTTTSGQLLGYAGIAPGIEHLFFLAAFSVSAALYFYHHLSSAEEPHEPVDKELRALARRRTSFVYVGATILAASALSLLLVTMMQGSLLALSSGNFALVIGVAMVLMSLVWVEGKVLTH